MASQESNSVRNGVIGTVLGGVILAVLAEIWPPFMSLLIWLWELLLALIGLLGAPYSVPGWLLLIVGLLATPTVVRFILNFRSPESPPHTRYVEDILYGTRWRWSWRTDSIKNLWCYCPRCDSELVYDDSSCRNLYADISKTDFICEHCGHLTVGSIVGGDKSYALSAIEREIRRKIRTNEFPQAETKN
jgi:predicted RNA-binding Zn-ribbon protein involved in translation (DUF1610 family)